ncbi:TPA: relaxase/mobilization nuclease domain-containing protein [Campylobacter fetus subsp. venerealis]|nr:relaxase/mobilization nuclease domain-containing protein [Campylobacter fetus subsp. venerealis]HDX6242636.1 relaxase/mobilization nuclease domain-containing protein [Campylobacter fetus subsp. venerealis]HDX6244563.1 relaxase/mobilization nuclease domain-containing protein [Campylobacter fetus subsp. venerealis]HDX6246568.1 relaxase/mobilization nuclease domain-containing protein [Campylobacter fetus subsp. venerealis]HDX6250535.1 relaxase/mobilization nuclease domain-containing protein [Ca
MAKNNFFDEDIFKAKRVIKRFEAKQKSTYMYSIKSKKSISYSNKKNSKEVVVKITGSAKDFEGLKGHIKYISRNGDIELFSSDNEIFSGKDDLKNAVANFNSGDKIPTKNELFTNAKKPKRETLNFVFSMKDHLQAPANKIQEAAVKVLKEKFSDNYFLAAIHNDTDNPHCHICLKITDAHGKRINPKKSDLDELRKNFALELNRMNIDAIATIRKKVKIDKDGKVIDEPEIKSHHYEVTGFGEAPYKFNADNDQSYYVNYKTPTGKIVTIWSKDLKKVVEDNQINVGEYCRFAITGEQEMKFVYLDKKTKNTIEKTTYKKMWDVSVNGRLEKELKPLKKYSMPTIKIIKKFNVDVKQNITQAVVKPKNDTIKISHNLNIQINEKTL